MPALPASEAHAQASSEPDAGEADAEPELATADSVPAATVGADVGEAEASEPEITDAGPTELARIIDPEALGNSGGARALLRLHVPPEWLSEGGALEIDTPERLMCGRCEGGGCESCANSGALNVGVEDRTLAVTLSGGPATAKRLRLGDPFGSSATIRQIFIDLFPRDGAAPKNVRWFPTFKSEQGLGLRAESDATLRSTRPPSTGWTPSMVVAAVVVILALALAIGFSTR